MTERRGLGIGFTQIEFANSFIRRFLRGRKNPGGNADRGQEVLSGQGGVNITAQITIDPEKQRLESIIGIYATGRETDPTKIADQLREQGFDQVVISSLLSEIDKKRQKRSNQSQAG